MFTVYVNTAMVTWCQLLGVLLWLQCSFSHLYMLYIVYHHHHGCNVSTTTVSVYMMYQGHNVSTVVTVSTMVTVSTFG